MKKPENEVPDDPRYDILTTLEGACFQSRFPYDKMTTLVSMTMPAIV